MSNEISIFDSNKNLPAYLRQTDLDDDLAKHAGSGYPVMSIKGKEFAIIRDGSRQVIPNPKDPDSPARFIDIVILKGNASKSKVFYAKGYTEGSDAKPDCLSNNGERPDESVENPVSSNCATCPKNAWGSRISDSGQKGKACQDSVRIAIATRGALNEPMLLRIPPASIKAIGDYADMLKKKGVTYRAVQTRVEFEKESPTPKLTFKPIDFLTESEYVQATAMLNEHVIESILGTAPSVPAVTNAAPAKAAEETKTSVEEALDVTERAKRTAKAKANTTKEVSVEEVKAVVAQAETLEPVSEAEVDLDLDDLSFDD